MRNIVIEGKRFVKEYKVGDTYGYFIRIFTSPFNPDYPGRAPNPRFPMEVHTMLKGKQTFYGLAIIPVFVEGLLTTVEKTNIPMWNNYGDWEELEETDVDALTYEEAVERGTKELRVRFEKSEKF